MTLLKFDTLQDFFESVGILFTAYVILKFFFTPVLQLLTFPFRKKHIERYGKDSWAVVTGASDGIGKAFCEELTKEGFNILLMARNKEKLEKVAKELKQINPSVQTKIIVFDFKNACNPRAFDSYIPEFQALDISLLVNNVGLGKMDNFENATQEDLKEIISVNIYPLTRLSKILITQFIKRTPKSGIINVGSLAGALPIAYFAAYSGTKVYAEYLTKALSIEYPKIDFLCLMPNAVSTAATNYKEIGYDTITPNQCARSGLRDLGYTTRTYGHWKHQIMGKGQEIMPEWVNNLVGKFLVMQEMKRKKNK